MLLLLAQARNLGQVGLESAEPSLIGVRIRLAKLLDVALEDSSRWSVQHRRSVGQIKDWCSSRAGASRRRGRGGSLLEGQDERVGPRAVLAVVARDLGC